MKFCTHCGKEIMEEAVICPACGCATINNNPMVLTQEDTVSVGLCILAAFIPLFGIIYWPVMHAKTPKRAKACGITALIAWGVSFLFTVLFWGVFLATLGLSV